MQVPTLESERLVLRPFRESDFEPMVEFYAGEVSRFYGGPCDRSEAWRKFAVFPGHWSLRGYGPWALEEKASGDFVGLSGMWFPDGWPEPEITWALVERYHGKGYATEAARRSLRAAYVDYGWPSAVSVVAKPNTASARVAQRLGAIADGTVENRYGTATIFRHLSPAEFLAAS